MESEPDKVTFAFPESADAAKSYVVFEPPPPPNVIVLLERAIVRLPETARVTASSLLSLPLSIIFSSVATLPSDAVKSYVVLLPLGASVHSKAVAPALTFNHLPAVNDDGVSASPVKFPEPPPPD